MLPAHYQLHVTGLITQLTVYSSQEATGQLFNEHRLNCEWNKRTMTGRYKLKDEQLGESLHSEWSGKTNRAEPLLSKQQSCEDCKITSRHHRKPQNEM